MAYGATDRVETAAWRSQAWRTADTPRHADSRPSRFDDMLARADRDRADQARADQTRADQTKADDAKADQEKTDQARTDRTKSDQTAADRAQSRRADDTTPPDRPVAGRGDASGPDRTAQTRPAGDATKDAGKAPPQDGSAQGDAVAGDQAAAPAAGKVAKPSDDTAQIPDGQGKPDAAGLIPAPGTPPLVAGQVPQAPAPTVAAGTPGAPPAGTQGIAAAGIPKTGGTAVAAGVATGATEATASEPALSDGKAGAADAKDFLSALADARQGSAAADAAPAAPAQGASGQGVSQGSSAAPAATVQAQAPAAPTPPAIPIGQVPMTIGLRSLAGSSEFQIRLDPVELGRIDVTLEIDKAKGTVATHLVVDRPDTLALLQRDADQLQQALTQAGLDPSAGGVNLSLRSDSQTGGADRRAAGRRRRPPGQPLGLQPRRHSP